MTTKTPIGFRVTYVFFSNTTRLCSRNFLSPSYYDTSRLLPPLRKKVSTNTSFSDAKLTIHRYISSKDSTVSSTWPAVLYTRIRILPVPVFNLKFSLHFCDPLNTVIFSRLISSSSKFIDPKKVCPHR